MSCASALSAPAREMKYPTTVGPDALAPIEIPKSQRKPQEQPSSTPQASQTEAAAMRRSAAGTSRKAPCRDTGWPFQGVRRVQPPQGTTRPARGKIQAPVAQDRVRRINGPRDGVHACALDRR